MAGGRLALLVATDTYEDTEFSQLHSPTADVQALRGVLEDPAIGGYTVGVLTNVPSYQVRQAINRMLANVRPDDIVLLYFSGHGYRDDDGQLYVVTRDSQRQLIDSTAVSAQFIREQLNKSRSKRNVVFLDCCNAGAFPEGRAAKGTAAVGALTALSGRGTVVITASSAIEYAFEGERPATPLAPESPAVSVFTGALVAGLSAGEADLDGDGLVAIEELYNYLYRKVKETRFPQTPEWRSEIQGTLYVATSPRGVRPAQLPLEVAQAVDSPLTSTRDGVIRDLIRLSGTHPSMRLAAQNALAKLAEDDSRRVAAAAVTALHEFFGLLATERSYDVSERAAEEIRAAAEREAAELRQSAAREAAQIINDARQRAAELQAEANQYLHASRVAREESVKIYDQAKAQAEDIIADARRRANQLALKPPRPSSAPQASSGQGPSAGPAASGSSRGLLGFGRAKPEPETAPTVPETKIVRQQPVRQARSKRSGGPPRQL